MGIIVVIFWKYNVFICYLKIFYVDGLGELYYFVFEFIYNNLVWCNNKIVFVYKYLEYDLYFMYLSIY